MNLPERFPPELIEALGWYVYVYIHPKTGQTFYVGKGCGDRVFHHLQDQGDSRKVEALNALRKAGLQPRIELLRYGLSEDQARLVEAAVIDLIGLELLTNRIRGQHPTSFGRVTVQDLIMTQAAPDAEITEPSILFRINKLYRSDMTELELEEATRGFWRLGKKLSKQAQAAQLAFAVYQGVIREVYQIGPWHPAGTLPYTTRDPAPYRDQDRWEFSAQVAREVRDRYLGHSVRHLFKQGAQSPTKYVNCSAGPG